MNNRKPISREFGQQTIKYYDCQYYDTCRDEHLGSPNFDCRSCCHCTQDAKQLVQFTATNLGGSERKSERTRITAKQKLYELGVEKIKDMSAAEISRRTGLSHKRIWDSLREMGVPFKKVLRSKNHFVERCNSNG